MPDIAPATSAPSTAPAQSSTPSQAPSSVPTSPAPVRSTTAELSDKLFSNGPSDEPSAESQHQAPSDYSWLDNYKEGVHGVPVQDLLQAISEGRLPDELHDKLRLNLKDGDHEWEGSVASMRNGAMMREKFSQQMNQLKQERDGFYGERNQFVEDLRGLKESPEQFLYSMQSMGMPVLEAAKMLATQYATRDYLNRQAGIQEGQRGPGDEWLEGKQAQMELQNHKRKQELQSKQQQQVQQQRQFEQRSTAVQSAAMEAFKAANIDPVKHPQYWDRAAQHLQRIYDNKPEPRDGSEKPLTRRDVNEAVRIVKEEIDTFLRSHGQQPAQQARPGAAPLDTRAGKQVSDRAPKQAGPKKTTDEIMREMRERQGVRIR
jgi:hypothetical protein